MTFTGFRETFVFLAIDSVTTEPGKRALDHPAVGQFNPTRLSGWPAHDFQFPITIHMIVDMGIQLIVVIFAIRPDLLQAWIRWGYCCSWW